VSAHEAAEDGTVTGINVTPMVDIILVLLIIFMATAHFSSNAGLKINLPKAATTDASSTPSLLVSLDARGAMTLMDAAVDLAGLKDNLARESSRDPGVRVTLAADGALPYRQVVGVLDAIKAAGVTRVALASER